ncbi:toll-like receptor 7 [Anthonomus grandis grandis]|uniref:toll-like receptor 7 n=1 Tax=Anthonomus grandis grandis TaxID=2921223 RepID=UPI0021669AB2|nr:toll-like receptor 7 [Anthonomus grandis grandis]
MRELILKMLFLVFVCVISVAYARFDGANEQCSWLPDNNDGSSKLAVTCNVRLLDEQAGNLTNIPQEVTSKLKIQCSNAIFYESILPSTLHRLHELEDLRISNCKILNIDSNTFEGLYNLKKLFINSFNVEWGLNKNLELTSLSFQGLKELQVLDLADNNIRALPEGAFCSLMNLQTLNLTRNKIRSTERIGISTPECSSSELQNLDLSFNDIRSLGDDSGLGKLRRLQHLNLQYNNITDLSGDSLAGLVSLKIVDLSNNNIGSLPQGLFAGSPELKEIHLQNNSLYALAKGLFHRLEQLLVLDLSGNQLTSSHVDNGTFSGLIRLIVLNLSHNALTRIDSRTFKDLFFLQILDLRNNSIGFIEDNAFLPLYNLHTLNLAENRLNTIGPHLFNGLFVLSKLTLNNNLIVTIDARAFQNCSALKELDLSSNALSQVPEAIQELSFLKTLDLGENQISEFFNGSFRNLNQLTGLRLIDNTIGNLTRGMLWDLPSLQVLNLAKNKIQTIERGTFERNIQIEAIRLDENFLTDINGVFATLATLLWLNLSENHLVWFDYAFIPSNLKWLDIHGNFIEHLGNYYKIQDEIGVKTLDASHNRITEISGMSIPNSVELLFINNNFIKKVHSNTFLDKTHLARVDMYANDLVNLDLNALRLTTVPTNRSIPEVYLGGNPFHCDCTMEWLQIINGMSASRQYPRIMDSDNVMCKMTHSRGMTHMPLSQTKASDFLCAYETHCFTLCHCCEFDACDCEMTCPNNCSCYHDQTWNTNVVDCSGQTASEIPLKIPMDATEVYLDGNNIKELHNHAFIGRKNLKTLFVNNSNVESIQNSTFNSLHALQVLHLEENKLRELKGYEFERLDNLKELYLQSNLIEAVNNKTFEPLTSLVILRIDGNRLTSFPVWQLNLNTRLTQIMMAANPWSCRCKFLQGLTSWVAENAVKVLDSASLMCSIPDSRPTQNRELDFNSTACSDYYAGSSVIDSMLVSDYWPMVVVTLCIVILMLLAIVLWFIFRDPVRVWLYSRYGVRLCNFRDSTSKQYDDSDKLYDAFVCYSPKDEEWVVHNLAAELEPRYQLCLHYRDIPNPAYIQHAAPAVIEASEASRRVVMVLTRNFLETEWSRFDLRQAFHEALKVRVYNLIIIELGPIQDPLMDPELKLYLKTAERVKWSDRRCWERLKYALPSVDSRGKINANYRRNINNYTIDSRVVANGTHPHHHFTHEKVRTQGPPSPGMQMIPPPAYSASGVPQELEDANYSSATTATPSPRPSRRISQEQRPISDHIYSSIDSDYSTLERGGSGRRMGPPQQWRPPHPHMVLQHGNHNGGQAYLV